ncbi:homeobox domain-containing protein [Aspergillus melleus]|uniref:homeobox domain-containing protein n=1 Tax=Aspergillus melleus TaxID=138277 RepID=UPI001E8DC02D|nr:uncharacterized protein LDX57_000150 [Aspergillus melleus]KAH8422395.1 hypothetical protein LDX57_000150 [Aspergillus melleus]
MSHANQCPPKFCDDVLCLPHIDSETIQPSDTVPYDPLLGLTLEDAETAIHRVNNNDSHADLESIAFPRSASAHPSDSSGQLNQTRPHGVNAETFYRGSFQDPSPSARDSASMGSSQSVYAEPAHGSRAQSAASSRASSHQEKTSQRLPNPAVKILNAWLSQHQQDPYPTSQEKHELEEQTGLSKIQITNWFTNARRRKMIGRLPTPSTDQVNNSFLSPLERWKHSPPETEAAATSDIMRALADTPYSSDQSSTQGGVALDGWSSNSSRSSFVFGAPSIEHSQSSGSEVSYRHSHSSTPYQRPPTPLPGMRARRHRRRRPPRPMESRKQGKKDDARPYQCTFCCDAFRSKYDWQRHEKALHLPVDRWRCAPVGGIVQAGGGSLCVFCRETTSDPEHLETHNYFACRQKPSGKRVFLRKDHLRQHLRLTHDVSYHPSMDDWQELTPRLISRCGFCDANFETWEERVEHIANHFKEGADMNQWKGEWGFEPDVKCLVENAMPPYLIGQERRTMDPWLTSTAVRSIEDEQSIFANEAPNALSRYVGLRQEIHRYLREQMAIGIHPSDQMVQDHARWIAYGNDDPWNQTYADEPAWIEALRREVGLADSMMLDERSPLDIPDTSNDFSLSEVEFLRDTLDPTLYEL